jgi:probable rRNA maturation factor
MISFSTQDVSFDLKKKREIKAWAKDLITGEGKKAGEICYIFCSDAYLGEMNRKYLKHDTLTDIITFDYSEEGLLSGDIFISTERVAENAGKFHTGFEKELGRVMAHGLLHLSGLGDKSPEQKEQMRVAEDKYLAHFPL